MSDVFCKSKGPQSPECKSLQYLVKIQNTVDTVKNTKQHFLGKNNDDIKFTQSKVQDITKQVKGYAEDKLA